MSAKLIDNKYDIAAVFTQPDKNRQKTAAYSAAGQGFGARKQHFGLSACFTENGDAAEIITSINPDIIIVVAYGKILPPSVLSIPKYGCINVHASLLPKYRGAAPIQWAVLNGDSETGVCIMQMDEGLDTGDIISEVKTNIDINETSEQLLTGFLLSVQTRLLMFCRKSKRETSALKSKSVNQAMLR